MAPEQARGDDLDPRCDVYAAGVILFELLTGGVPFSGKNAISVMTAHLTEPPPPPSRLAPDKAIPPALDAAVLHALAKKPSERYASATALATAVGTALRRPRDVASTAPPPPDDEIATRDTELSLEPPDMASRAAASDPPPKRISSTRVWVWVALFAAMIGILAGLVFSLLH
jgi:serine/threonine-protein kinase